MTIPLPLHWHSFTSHFSFIICERRWKWRRWRWSALKAGKQSAVFLSFQTSTQEEDARVLWLCAGRRASLQKTNEEDQVNRLPYMGINCQCFTHTSWMQCCNCLFHFVTKPKRSASVMLWAKLARQWEFFFGWQNSYKSSSFILITLTSGQRVCVVSWSKLLQEMTVYTTCWINKITFITISTGTVPTHSFHLKQGMRIWNCGKWWLSCNNV